MKNYKSNSYIFNKVLFILAFITIISCNKNEDIKFHKINEVALSNGIWSQYNMPPDWKYRDGATLIVFKEKLYMLGGWTYDEPYTGGTVVNEIWESEDGKNWKKLINAPWPARHGFATVVHNNRLFIIGGDLYNDCWSTDDCRNWVLEGTNLPFGGRYTPNAVSKNGSIILYGGVYWKNISCLACECTGFDDVWTSKDGKNWSILARVPWKPRGLIHGSIIFNDKIYVIGGGLKDASSTNPATETSYENSDIWSSNDGINWNIETDDFGIPTRTHFSLLYAFGAIWLSDGSVHYQKNTSNDLYYSLDGKKFTKVYTPLHMPKRHASSFVEFKNSLIIIGGPPTDTPRSTVFVYKLKF